MLNVYNNHLNSWFFLKANFIKNQFIKVVFSFLLLMCSMRSFAQDTWVQKSDIGFNTANVPQPHSRDGAVSFSINGKGYIGTGIYSTGGDGDYATANDFWEYNPATDTWSQKADFAGLGRYSATAFSIGNKGYIGLGSEQFGSSAAKDFWEYDPAANKWTQKADFGGPGSSDAVGFSIGSKGYIGTGEARNFWEYDPVTNLWTQKADFGGHTRGYAVGFSIDSMGYIGTGVWNGVSYKDFWQYNPATNKWTRKADFGGGERDFAAGFSIGSKGYIGMGNDTSNEKDFWEYDPATNLWTRKADFGGGAGGGPLAFVINGKGYDVAGNNIWEYDPVTNNWIQKGDFVRYPRTESVGMSIGNKGYIGTGFEGGYEKDFWEYDPATNSWSQKAAFGGSARSGAIAFSINGKGYIGTGRADTGYTKDFWEYDPAANTWKQKGDFGGFARNDAVGFSIGNKGYVGTGNYNNNSLRDFWEYDPVTDAWTKKAAFPEDRDGATGFSIGNKGYIGTGFSHTLLYANDFWEYDPSTNKWTRKADLNAGRDYAVSFSINGKGYIGTGEYSNFYTPSTTADFEEYDPVADTWTRKPDFGGGRRSQAAGFAIGSHGYIGTGYDEGSDGSNKDFWEYTPSGVLAVAFTGLSAVLQNTNALLNWQAAGEEHTQYFNIQRSFNGINFTTISTQKVTSGFSGAKYSFTDLNVTALQQQTIFYRLQSVDNDGGSTLSNIVQLKIKISNDILIKPNPNRGKFLVEAQLPARASLTTFELYNAFGAKVWQQEAGVIGGSITRNIDLKGNLSAGEYLLIIRQNGTKLIEKVIVSK